MIWNGYGVAEILNSFILLYHKMEIRYNNLITYYQYSITHTHAHSPSPDDYSDIFYIESMDMNSVVTHHMLFKYNTDWTHKE